MFGDEYEEKIESQERQMKLSERLCQQSSFESISVPITSHSYSQTHSVSAVGDKGKIFSFKPSVPVIKNEPDVTPPFEKVINKRKEIDTDNDNLNNGCLINEGETGSLISEIRNINQTAIDLRHEFNFNIASVRKELQALNENLFIVAQNLQNFVQNNKRIKR